eukprot:1141549-Pelagomonas_calceolata.AAC.4
MTRDMLRFSVSSSSGALPQGRGVRGHCAATSCCVVTRYPSAAPPDFACYRASWMENSAFHCTTRDPRKGPQGVVRTEAQDSVSSLFWLAQVLRVLGKPLWPACYRGTGVDMPLQAIKYIQLLEIVLDETESKPHPLVMCRLLQKVMCRLLQKSGVLGLTREAAGRRGPSVSGYVSLRALLTWRACLTFGGGGASAKVLRVSMLACCSRSWQACQNFPRCMSRMPSLREQDGRDPPSLLFLCVTCAGRDAFHEHRGLCEVAKRVVKA